MISGDLFDVVDVFDGVDEVVFDSLLSLAG